MKKRTATAGSLAAGAIILAAQPVLAQLVYEPFDYGSAATATNLGNLSANSGYVNPSNGIPWTDMQNAAGNTGEITLGNTSLGGATGQAPAVGGDAVYANANATTSRS